MTDIITEKILAQQDQIFQLLDEIKEKLDLLLQETSPNAPSSIPIPYGENISVGCLIQFPTAQPQPELDNVN